MKETGNLAETTNWHGNSQCTWFQVVPVIAVSVGFGDFSVVCSCF